MIILNNINAERSVLSTLMMYEEQYDVISNLIVKDDFESSAHQVIYAAITELAEQNQPHDLLMVSDLLESKSGSNDLSYINKRLSEAAAAPTAMPRSLIAHAELIRASALRRKSLEAAKRAIQSLEDNEPVDDVNNTLVSELSNLEQQGDTQEVFTIDDMMKGLIERMQSASDGAKPYIDTGFPELDNLMRVNEGNLVVIAARPSMGKSLLVMNIQAHLSKYREGVSVFFSIEMEQSDLMNRLTASETGIPINNLVENKLSEDQAAALQRFATDQVNMRLEIVRKPNINLSQIRTHLNKMKRQHGKIGSIGIDYLQIMGGIDGDDSVKRIGVVTRTLKALGSEFGCPVFLLSQLNRSVESRPNKRPVLSDLRDSGTIEQDADIVLFPYREDYYKQKDGGNDLDGMADIIIAKNRNAKTGVARLAFEGHLGRFSNSMPFDSSFNDIPSYGEQQ